MSNETIVAIFRTRAEADSARSALESAGVPAGSIDIRANVADETDRPPEHKSFWDWLFGESGPEERHAYRDGLSSGNALLSVRSGSVDSTTIQEVLHRYDPLDIDEQGQSSGLGSGSAGWTGDDALAARNAAVLGNTSGSDRRFGSSTNADAGMAPGGGLTGGGIRAAQGSALPNETVGTEVPGHEAVGTTGDGTVIEPRSGSMGMSDETDRLSDGGLGSARIGERVAGAAGEEGVIPIVQEELAVGKRMVDRGTVRVRSYVMETPVEQSVDLRQETISVERRRPMTGADAPAGALEERVIEVTQRGEEPVIEKRARVTEEVVVRREESSRAETVRDTVRGTEVEVERDGVLENRDR